MREFSYLFAVGLCFAAPGVTQTKGADAPKLDELPIEQLMGVEVQTASLRKQTLQDAPATVTVITAEEIRRFGYRTLGEVLSNVRSFYTTSDGPFHFAGVRGFSLLGDYNTRFLVMINGHRLTDNAYGAMYYFGQDFPLDMDLVGQIEIVRGPSSALYGGAGIFATINIITKTPTSSPRMRVSADVGSFGEQNVAVSGAFPLGRGARALVSASGFHADGRTVDFPELAQAGAPSQASHVGYNTGYHAFANLSWNGWTVTGMFGESRAIATNGWYGAKVGDTGTRDLERRGFVEAVWDRQLSQKSAIEWRGYYDQFRYDGVYAGDIGDPDRNYDGAAGDWIGNQAVYHRDMGKMGNLTAGVEAAIDLRNTQYGFNINGTGSEQAVSDSFRISHRRASYGVFAQQELKLAPAWTVYAGGRLDGSSTDAVFLSPRLAVVHTRQHAAYKLMYGRGFRNPSTYERYWEPNPALEAERIDTFEVSREQVIRKRLNLVLSSFHYRLHGLIEGVPTDKGTLQYQNASKADATGFETELNGHPADRVESSASFSLQRTRIDAGQRMENSPVRLGRFRTAVSMAHQRLVLAAAVRYMGSRLSASAYRVPSVTLADVTVTATKLRSGLDLQLGVRNLMNTAYSDPLSPEHTPQLLPREGRSLFLKVTWRDE